MVLDLMLPDGDGSALCRELRTSGKGARVLMLTARTLEDDLVKGFEAGADDYLAKPYRLRELLARVAALARRGGLISATHTLGHYQVDETRRTVTGPEGAVELTRKEFDLLVCLLRAGDAVVKRDDILDAVWGDVVVDTHTVDNFVSSLKKKLKAETAGFELRTVRGIGFRLVK
ncbi:MAG: response regulator transcription factor [Archangium sp.]|nr:response regulator transcription factor [Archangium sp.]